MVSNFHNKVVEQRNKAKLIGRTFWIIFIVFGIPASLFLHWYIFPVALVIGYLGGTVYSIYLSRKLEREAGYDINAQSMICEIAGGSQINTYPSSIEENVEWSQSKKIEVVGPEFFGKYSIYIDCNFNVAIFLPKSDKTLHIFIGDIVRANRWIKCDQNGKRVIDENPPEKAFQWKINYDRVLYRGTGFPPEKDIYYGEVISSEDFTEEINEEWLCIKINEYVVMMSN